ncbi:hypothetical protein R0C86_001224 [Pseudomonas aeruginosa]|nr:hypothetical protein [Pseudomonas aeruginosa]
MLSQHRAAKGTPGIHQWHAQDVSDAVNGSLSGQGLHMSEHVESLLEQQLQEMRQTNALLAQLIESNTALIEALAQSDDAEIPMLSYLDGSRL